MWRPRLRDPRMSAAFQCWQSSTGDRSPDSQESPRLARQAARSPRFAQSEPCLFSYLANECPKSQASALDRHEGSDGDHGSDRRSVARLRSDVQCPAQRVEAVLHVGEPIAAKGGADVEAATIVGDLDAQPIPVLV